jgi:hypothetical protein
MDSKQYGGSDFHAIVALSSKEFEGHQSSVHDPAWDESGIADRPRLSMGGARFQPDHQ